MQDNDMRGRVILLTGGAGTVGLNICEHLLRRGADVIVFGRHPMRDEDARYMPKDGGKLHYFQGDVLRPENFDAVYSQYKISDVIHGAAFTATNPQSERDWTNTVIEVNCLGVMNSLNAAKGRIPGRFLLLGSGGAYGLTRYQGGAIIEGESPFEPVSLYEISKFAADRIVTRYAQLFDMDARVARVTAVYGPYEHYTGVRALMSPVYRATALAMQGKPVRLLHSYYNDWVYATDVALAVIGMVKAEKLDRPIYPLTCGERWSLMDWCELLKTRYPGFTSEIVDDPALVTIEESNVPKERGNLKIDYISDLGYPPQFGLKKSFEDYMAWIEAHPGYIQLA